MLGMMATWPPRVTWRSSGSSSAARRSSPERSFCCRHGRSRGSSRERTSRATTNASRAARTA
eukprot:1781704-Heterocapsa_arctica.AAC.1